MTALVGKVLQLVVSIHLFSVWLLNRLTSDLDFFAFVLTRVIGQGYGYG